MSDGMIWHESIFGPGFCMWHFSCHVCGMRSRSSGSDVSHAANIALLRNIVEDGSANATHNSNKNSSLGEVVEHFWVKICLKLVRKKLWQPSCYQYGCKIKSSPCCCWTCSSRIPQVHFLRLQTSILLGEVVVARVWRNLALKGARAEVPTATQRAL